MDKLLSRFENESLYSILQIERDATEDQLKKSFKKLAKEYHPDKNKSEDACNIILYKTIHFNYLN